MKRQFWPVVRELLAGQYGVPERTKTRGDWLTLVRAVLAAGRKLRKAADWSWIAETALGDPGDTAALSDDRLAEILHAAGHAPTRARSLHGLAQWWLRRAADVDRDFPLRSVETWQDELRAIPGVNWELADRILLVVFAQDVYPLDRGSLRIAARHGWMDISSEYEDWQAFFTGAQREADIDLVQLSHWNALVARDFCKTQPRCDECPLKSLLPERGPVAIEGYED